MEIKLDTTLLFPVDSFYEGNYDKLFKYCGSPEDIENNFNIELSCGDGKYFSDFWKWTENGEALIANWPDTPEADEELAKYDGEVCLETPPRFRPIKMSMVPETMKPNKLYRFTIKYFPKTEEEVYYINGKERNRKWVG